MLDARENEGRDTFQQVQTPIKVMIAAARGAMLASSASDAITTADVIASMPSTRLRSRRSDSPPTTASTTARIALEIATARPRRDGPIAARNIASAAAAVIAAAALASANTRPAVATNARSSARSKLPPASRVATDVAAPIGRHHTRSPVDKASLVRGHIDGVILGGPAIGVAWPVLWEHKALNAKSWGDVVKRGVALSKPVYFAQLQIYMAYMELGAALFTALNKDTQELHHEVVPFDPTEAQTLSDKAVDVIRAAAAGELPPRIAANPDFYLCRWCAYAARCWEGVR